MILHLHCHDSLSPTTFAWDFFALTHPTTIISTPTTASVGRDSRHDFERLFEIRDDVFDMFNAYGYLFQGDIRVGSSLG